MLDLTNSERRTLLILISILIIASVFTPYGLHAQGTHSENNAFYSIIPLLLDDEDPFIYEELKPEEVEFFNNLPELVFVDY